MICPIQKMSVQKSHNNGAYNDLPGHRFQHTNAKGNAQENLEKSSRNNLHSSSDAQTSQPLNLFKIRPASL